MMEAQPKCWVLLFTRLSVNKRLTLTLVPATMEEEVFMLPATFRGEELELQITLKPYGYTYRFEVNVNGIQVQFEPDEERNYRALVSPEQLEANRSKLDVALLQTIAQRLKALHG